jgi:hypothetical protein
MDGNTESSVRCHGGGEALFKRRLAITVILFVVSAMMSDLKLILHEEDTRDGHQYGVVTKYVLYHTCGDKSVPFRLEYVGS